MVVSKMRIVPTHCIVAGAFVLFYAMVAHILLVLLALRQPQAIASVLHCALRSELWMQEM